MSRGAVAENPVVPVTVMEIVTLAERHRIGPPTLERLALRLRPNDEAAAQKLLDRARFMRLNTLHQTAVLVSVSSELSSNGIRHLAIKGPAMARCLYGDFAARHSKDLDLFIDPASVESVATILYRLGFRDVATRNATKDHIANKHRSFVNGAVELEVHTRLIDVDALLPLAFEAIWLRREMVEIGAISIPTMSATDTFLYLCAHGASHLWFRLKWLEDIARIVAGGHPSTIAEALALARLTGAETLVSSALILVEEVFGIPPPPGIVLSKTHTSRGLVRLSQLALAGPADHASAPPLKAIMRKLVVQFRMGRHWGYRFSLAKHLLLSPRTFDVEHLPRGMGWLRLPLRPVMLLRDRHGRRP